MNCLFNNPFSLSAEHTLPGPSRQSSLTDAQFGDTHSGGDFLATPTTAASTAPTAVHPLLGKDPLVDISLKMLQALEPRLQRRPEVTGFGNFAEAVLEELPGELRLSAIEEMSVVLMR